LDEGCQHFGRTASIFCIGRKNLCATV
jgi:hypothetical protein